MKTRAERRKNDFNKAIRKKNIAEECYGFSYYNNLHQYSKNKIHCSCPLCAGKTNNKKGLLGSTWKCKKNYTISDKKKIDSLDNQLEDM